MRSPAKQPEESVVQGGPSIQLPTGRKVSAEVSPRSSTFAPHKPAAPASDNTKTRTENDQEGEEISWLNHKPEQFRGNKKNIFHTGPAFVILTPGQATNCSRCLLIALRRPMNICLPTSPPSPLIFSFRTTRMESICAFTTSTAASLWVQPLPVQS